MDFSEGGKRSTRGNHSNRLRSIGTPPTNNIRELKHIYIVKPIEMTSFKMWEKLITWHANCSLAMSVRDSKTSHT